MSQKRQQVHSLVGHGLCHGLTHFVVEVVGLEDDADDAEQTICVVSELLSYLNPDAKLVANARGKLLLRNIFTPNLLNESARNSKPWNVLSAYPYPRTGA